MPTLKLQSPGKELKLLPLNRSIFDHQSALLILKLGFRNIIGKLLPSNTKTKNASCFVPYKGT